MHLKGLISKVHFGSIMINNNLRNILGSRVIKKIKDAREFILLVPNMFIDMYRYARFSSTGLLGGNRFLHLQGLIVKDYHRIEKGLALPVPRLGFGETVLARLDKNLQDYIRIYGHDFHVECAVVAILSYRKFHIKKNYELPFLIANILKKWHEKESACGDKKDAVDKVSRADLFCQEINFEKFARSRRSIRNFSCDVIESSEIKKAISIARYAPSVCNRQTVKVYYFQNKGFIQRILKEQNGNAGFGHTCSALCLIVYDLSFFEGAGERNQGFVDGGIFLSHLLLAFHSLKIGACPLNWSVGFFQDGRLRDIIGLPSKEVIVSLVAIGVPDTSFYVARSPRRPVEEVLVMDDCHE